jgi:hypothetical protein
MGIYYMACSLLLIGIMLVSYFSGAAPERGLENKQETGSPYLKSGRARITLGKTERR